MLTSEDKKQLGKNLVACFKLFGRELSFDSCAFMIEALSEFPVQKTIAALFEFTKKDKTGRPPTVGNLIDLINPQASNDALANDAASRIMQAISRFGWPDPEGARAFIGELGWSVVRRFGGWQSLCENHGGEVSVTTFHAQARELAKSQMELAKMNMLDSPPGLTTKTSACIDESNVVKLLKPREIPK